MNYPIRAGIALALTVGIGYTACAAVFWFWPEAAANLMNALFHGLDFRKLLGGPTMFSLGSFAYALGGMMAWAFGMGALFGLFSGRLSRAS